MRNFGQVLAGDLYNVAMSTIQRSALRAEVIHIFAKGHQQLGHDIDHPLRSAELAERIAEHENYPDINEAWAGGLLHDMGRAAQPTETGHGPAGVPVASRLLDKYTDFDASAKQRILKAIEVHSRLNQKGKLTHIIQDADMLDGMGSIGLERAVKIAAALRDCAPDNIIPVFTTKPRDQFNIQTTHERIAMHMNWINLVHTPIAKRIAAKRWQTMQQFLETYRDEATLKDFS